jgi:hypothetical protein
MVRLPLLIARPRALEQMCNVHVQVARRRRRRSLACAEAARCALSVVTSTRRARRRRRRRVSARPGGCRVGIVGVVVARGEAGHVCVGALAAGPHNLQESAVALRGSFRCGAGHDVLTPGPKRCADKAGARSSSTWDNQGTINPGKRLSVAAPRPRGSAGPPRRRQGHAHRVRTAGRSRPRG